MVEGSGWLQSGQICSPLLPIAFPVFMFVSRDKRVGMPTTAIAAGYASLASSANKVPGSF